MDILGGLPCSVLRTTTTESGLPSAVRLRSVSIVRQVPTATTAHPECCPDPASCDLDYVDHLRGFAVSAEATPTRKPHAAESITKDRALDRDLDAYQRLRADGVQPPSNLGCARLEAGADHRWQVESKPRQEGES